jgi:hypothetical protein
MAVIGGKCTRTQQQAQDIGQHLGGDINDQGLLARI